MIMKYSVWEQSLKALVRKVDGLHFELEDISSVARGVEAWRT